MNEFDFIAKLLKPLATNPAALKLADDAALLSPKANHELVITTDTLVASVHFIGNEPANRIAQKALRVNLSDLAAMGATPLGYFLNLSLPKDTSETWLSGFAEGLHEDQNTYHLSLLGGDTTRTPGPLTISITALGQVPAGKALKRSGAKIGDLVYVSGTIGDAALFLKMSPVRASCAPHETQLKAGSASLPHITELEKRYQLPTPQLALGEQLRDVATSCMDISDGLVQDLGHICAASKVGAVIHANKIPLSATAQKADAMETALTGGDDYELLFTAPKDAKLPSGVICIGEITHEQKVTVFDANGAVFTLKQSGFTHF